MPTVILSKSIVVRSCCTKCDISMKSFYTTKMTTITGIQDTYLKHGLSECPICKNTLMEPMLIICNLI